MKLSKLDVLNEYEKAWADVRAAKHGEVFDEVAERLTEQLIIENRDSIIEVFKDWIREASGPTALEAVRLAERFDIWELTGEICDLDERIRSQRVLLPYYSRWTERAIKSLNSKHR